MTTLHAPLARGSIPDREPSRAFVTVGAGGQVYPLPDPGRVFTVRSLGELETRAGAWGGWRFVWLTPAAVEYFGCPAKRKGPIELPAFKVRAAQWETGSPFAGVTDPLELFLELWRFEAALGGVGWLSSGAVTSDVLLRHIHRPPRGRPIMPTELPPPAIKKAGRRAPGGELPAMWHRAPGPGDVGDWVHHFDLNGAYLAAASKLRLPQGRPVELDDSTDPGKVPGYWRIEPAEWDIPSLPAPWSKPPKGSPLWVTTPTLRFLREIEWPARVVEGWYWPETCEALTGWYERLRDARMTLNGPAREAVKQVYRMGVGRLGSDARARLDDPLYQPAWSHHLIAEARCRILRRLFTLAGVTPLAVETDGVWIQHELSDPADVAGVIGLPLGDRLGQWRPLGTVRALDVAQVLTGPDRAIFARLKELEG